MIATHGTKESTYVQEEKHALVFKGRVGFAALSGMKTVAALSAEFGVNQTLIHKWVKQIKESAAGIFPARSKPEMQKRKSRFMFFTPKAVNYPRNAIFSRSLWTHAIPVSLAGGVNHQAQSGLVRGYHVHPHAQSLFVPDGCYEMPQ